MLKARGGHFLKPLCNVRRFWFILVLVCIPFVTRTDEHLLFLVLPKANPVTRHIKITCHGF